MWMLPVVAITGVSVRRVLGFTSIGFFVMVAVYGGCLLIFAR
jgi:short-chain fatty acids transporter